MNDTRPVKSRRSKFLRFILYSLGTLLLLVTGLLYALTLPAVQQRLTREAQAFLENKLKTRVEIGSVGLRFPYHLSLEKFLLEDQNGDTLVRVGSLMVSVDMWKLLDQRIELQQVTLEDAAAYLHKKDSIYNFDFIVSAFSNPDAPRLEKADTSASGWKLQIDLTVLQLDRVHFRMQDDDTQSSMRADIGSLETTLKRADFDRMYFELDGLNLADSDMRMVQTQKSVADGSPPTAFSLLLNNAALERSHVLYATPELSLDAALDETRLGRLEMQSADQLNLKTEGLEVKNSAIAYRDPETTPTPGHLNAADLGLSRLNVDLPQFSMHGDTMQMAVASLSGFDKSGLQVHSLNAGIHITPQKIALDNAQASLNNTRLDGNVLLLRKDTVFERMQVELRQLKGIVGDLIVLLPPQENAALTQLSATPYELSGRLDGWFDQLRLDGLKLKAGKGTAAALSGTLQNLTDTARMSMNLHIANAQTTREDLVQWMSLTDTPRDSVLAQPLPAHLHANGLIEGSLSNLKLDMNGELGALQTGATFPADTASALQFEVAGSLQHVSNPDQLGIDLDIRKLQAPHAFFAFLESEGMRFPDMLDAAGSLRGHMEDLNIVMNINALRGGQNSELQVQGNLKNLRNTQQAGFNLQFNAALTRAEILGYVPDSVVTPVLRLPDMTRVKGAAKGNRQAATGNLQVALGSAGNIYLTGNLQDSTYHADVRAENIRLSQLAADTALRPLQLLSFNARVDGTGFQLGKTARLKFNGVVDSLIWDNVILRELRLAADINGKKFVGTFESPDDRMAVRARVEGDLEPALPTIKTDLYLNCVDLREFGWSRRPTTICMHLRSESEGLSLDSMKAIVAIEDLDLQYDTVHVRPGNLSLELQLQHRNNRLAIESDWLKGEIGGYFSPAELSTTISNITEQYFVVDRTQYVPRVGADSVSVDLHLLRPDVLTTGLIPGLSDLAPVRLEGALIARRNYFNLEVHAPRVVYDNWQVDSLTIRSYAGDSAAMFVLTTPLVRRGNEDFIQNTELKGQFIANTARVTFNARDEEGRERFVLALQAAIGGSKKETTVTFAPRQIIDFKEWNVDAYNRIRIMPGGVEIERFSMQGAGQSIEIEGNTRTVGKKTNLDLAVDIDRINYNNFDLLVAETLRELGGWAEAHLTIGGSTDALKVRGKVQFHETYFTPALTNVRYELSDTPLEFTENGISLDGLRLRDPAGHDLEINGRLTTSDWKDIRSNLTLKAQGWQALNSTKQQNPVYYGEVYVDLNGTIKGPLSQPDIQLVVGTARESRFTYVYDAATQALQHEGIVYFVPPPRRYVRPPVYDAPVNEQPFTLSASIEIDSNLTISSVIDPVTGDDFRGKATGKLQLDVLPNGNMTLVGRVELVRGVYNYSYQSVVKRSFEVATGSNITWTGDITRPELDLKARYQFKASPYPLVVNQLSAASAEEAAAYRQPQIFFLQTSISGSVTEPNINFQFL
ncbi:MAG: translocation/assembly module TamB domain-containing protein, partial [Saprospiraceae bacterium]|nr:translocation/assembly module TamB domain-containing protein [Saprospiraceae bacterium]